MRTDPARFAFCSPLSFHRPLFFIYLNWLIFPPPSPLWCSLPLSPPRFRRTSEEKVSVQRRRPRSARLSVVWLSVHVFCGNDPLAPHYRQNAVTSLLSYGPFHWPRWLKRQPGPICSRPQSQKTSLVFSYTDEGDRYNPCRSRNVLLYRAEQAGNLFHHTNTQTGQVFVTWEGWNASFKEGLFSQCPKNMPSKPRNCSNMPKKRWIKHVLRLHCFSVVKSWVCCSERLWTLGPLVWMDV